MSELESWIKKINKEAGSEIIAFGNSEKEYERIPFSSPRANYCLYGGIPKYRLIEFAGLESSGKTTSALDICKNYQLEEGHKNILFVDVEHTFDEEWAATLGVNPEEIVVLSPESEGAETVFDIILDSIRTDLFGLIIIDSLAALIPNSVKEESLEDKKEMGGIAASLTRFSKECVSILKRYKCTVIGINQLRDDMNNPYNLYSTPGGKAWKFLCSVRLFFSLGSFINSEGKEVSRSTVDPAGNRVDIKVEKTKICRKDRRNGFYTLKYLTGIDELTDTIDTAVELGFIQSGGAWFTLTDIDTGELILDKKFQGKTKVIEYFKQNTEEYTKLWEAVNNKICEHRKDI